MFSISSITYEKYLIISGLLIINGLLSGLTIVYNEYWYIFIIILGLASLINSICVFLVLFNYLRNKIVKNDNMNDYSYKCKYIYVLPCYNETEKELNNTIESIYSQLIGINFKRCSKNSLSIIDVFSKNTVLPIIWT